MCRPATGEIALNALATSPPNEIKQGRPKLRDVMGPGLITGASEDDPSGMATYFQGGLFAGYRAAFEFIFRYED